MSSEAPARVGGEEDRGTCSQLLWEMGVPLWGCSSGIGSDATHPGDQELRALSPLYLHCGGLWHGPSGTTVMKVTPPT